MQFLGTFGKIVCWRPPPPGSWRPHFGEILDPPLVGEDSRIHDALIELDEMDLFFACHYLCGGSAQGRSLSSVVGSVYRVMVHSHERQRLRVRVRLRQIATCL